MAYLLTVTAHVLSAIVAFGGVFAVRVLRRQIDDPAVAARVELALARRVVTPAMVGLLLTGLIQVAAGPYGFGAIWLDTALTVLVVIFGIVGAGITRDARALAAADGHDQRRRVHLTRSWDLCAVLVVVALTLMVLKPG